MNVLPVYMPPHSEWLKDYLKNRSVQVLLGNSVSEVLSTPFSVPHRLCAGFVLI